MFHVAIIPDGNRRWAKERGLAPKLGHKAGRITLETLMDTIDSLAITHLSFWGASVDNLTKRTIEEVAFLDAMFLEEFERLIDHPSVHRQRIRVNVVGEWRAYLSEPTIHAAEHVMRVTVGYREHTLTVLVAYDGIREMEQAVCTLVERGRKDAKFRVTHDAIRTALMTSDLPPVDLLIRTGGEPHNSSGFMMWLTANTQLIFSPVLWPDFTPEALTKAVEEFHRRKRRFGA